MKSDGSKVKRISFGNGLYGTPVWSPRGDLIAFQTTQRKILYRSNENRWNGERLLTENYYQEAPSWSPNGRVLIFYRETKSNSDGEDLQQNFGLLILQAIMKDKLLRKQTPQTHLGPHY